MFPVRPLFDRNHGDDYGIRHALMKMTNDQPDAQLILVFMSMVVASILIVVLGFIPINYVILVLFMISRLKFNQYMELRKLRKKQKW